MLKYECNVIYNTKLSIILRIFSPEALCNSNPGTNRRELSFNFRPRIMHTIWTNHWLGPSSIERRLTGKNWTMMQETNSIVILKWHRLPFCQPMPTYLAAGRASCTNQKISISFLIMLIPSLRFALTRTNYNTKDKTFVCVCVCITAFPGLRASISNENYGRPAYVNTTR